MSRLQYCERLPFWYSCRVKLTNLEAALNKRPFRPIELRVDGEVIVFQHPDQVLFAEGRTTLVVVDSQDHVHILEVDQISKVRMLPRNARAATAG